MDSYFDFDEASSAMHSLGTSYKSDSGNCDESDAVENFEALFWDKSATLPTDPPSIRMPGVDTTSVPGIPAFELAGTDGIQPVQRAKEPCDLCRQRGLDCFIALRGALLHGCTCCISLYRECSFTHKQTPGVWMATLGPVGEDVQKESGEMVGKAIMKSIPGAYNFEDSQSRKNGSRFSREATKILKLWLSEHANHPYPTEQEKDDLKQLTGLKRSQISNWLANARRRGKVRPAGDDELTYPGAVQIPQPDPVLQNLNPMERWKISPPEHEPAAMTAIARAVNSESYQTTGRNSSSSSANRSRQDSRQGSRQGSSHHQSSSNDESSYSMFQAPSISSFGTGQSATTSVSSLKSGYSHGSLKDRRDRRRRRRTPLTKPTATIQKYRSARIFQCTFCTDTFAAKYDWTRHEKSLHLALERWTCAPNGAVIEENGVRTCVFCSAINPDAAHLESHNYSACEEKTVAERTFYRKDHLTQHLRLLHGCAYRPNMVAWKSQTTSIKSKCGFCPVEFTTWNQRADHLAAHFKNGCDMSTWQGGWGFEPYVERLVENAMPPYMIAAERNTLDPFIATKRCNSPPSGTDGTSGNTTSATGSPDQVYNDSNCWRRCELGISQFIQQELAAGRIPSDSQLQTKARWIIYGDDDPWNQSPADNKQWLALVKKQNGLNNGEGLELEPPKRADGEIVTRVEELPINPPYCIKGGLKRGKKTEEQVQMPCTFVDLPPEHIPSGRMVNLQSSIDPFVDQLDLNALDLAMIDDTLDLSKIELNEFVPSTGVEMFPSQQVMTMNDLPDVFGGQDMELDPNPVFMPTTSGPNMISMSMSTMDMPAVSTATSQGFDMSNLAEYMQSFRQ